MTLFTWWLLPLWWLIHHAYRLIGCTLIAPCGWKRCEGIDRGRYRLRLYRLPDDACCACRAHSIHRAGSAKRIVAHVPGHTEVLEQNVIYITLHSGSALVTCINVVVERLRQHSLNIGRKLGVQRSRSWIAERRVIARVSISQQVMQCRGKGIQVRARVGVALILFWWCITRRAKCGSLFMPGIASDVGTSNTKIHEVRTLVFRANDNVRGFDITMDNGRRLLREILKD